MYYNEGSKIGSYRLNKILTGLEEMATSPVLTTPIDFLPVTRFPRDERLDTLHDIMVETEKERKTIQAQPYRTTQLVFPNPKPKPDLVKTKFGAGKPVTYRPLDQKSVIANINDNHAIVNRQHYNNPRALYSDQNVSEAIYVQTGLNYQAPQPQPQQRHHQQQQMYSQPMQQLPRPLQQHPQQAYAPPMSPRSTSALGPPIHLKPEAPLEWKGQNSPTYRAILEEEGPGREMPAVSGREAAMRRQGQPPQLGGHHGHQGHHQQAGGYKQPQPHYTAPTYQLNSVGMPTERIAQSHSFKRLMYSVMGDY